VIDCVRVMEGTTDHRSYSWPHGVQASESSLDLLGGKSGRRLRVLRVPASEDAVDGRGSLGVGGVECFTRRGSMRGSDWALSLGLAVIGWPRSVFLGVRKFGKGDPYMFLSILSVEGTVCHVIAVTRLSHIFSSCTPRVGQDAWDGLRRPTAGLGGECSKCGWRQ